MGENFFAVGRPGYYLLILVFLGCIAAVLYLNRRRTRTATRAEQLQKTYAVMTPALLEKTPDEEVVSAVIANLMAKLREHNPDPLITVDRQIRRLFLLAFVQGGGEKRRCGAAAKAERALCGHRRGELQDRRCERHRRRLCRLQGNAVGGDRRRARERVADRAAADTVRCLYPQSAGGVYGRKQGVGMKKLRTVSALLLMILAAVAGFFIGAVLDAAMMGAVLFALITGIACVIYNLDNHGT